METVRPQTPNQELAGIEEGLPATHQPESESFPDQQGQGTLELESIESKDATPSSHGGQIDGCWQHGSHRGMDGVVRQRERRPEHWFWYSLPRAAKATMILVCISTVMMIAYSIVTISLSSEDEEAHIATVIIVRGTGTTLMCGILEMHMSFYSVALCIHRHEAAHKNQIMRIKCR